MMKYLLLCLAMTMSCANDGPYTWRDATEEFASQYCHALDGCGYINSQHQGEVCEVHAAFHLCEPDGSCEVRIDEKKARIALDMCATGFARPEYQLPFSNECYSLVWGYTPAECQALWDLNPGPQDPLDQVLTTTSRSVISHGEAEYPTP